jgi:heptosyltransferase-3
MQKKMQIEKEKVKKILVIKLRNLGDVLLTTPVFSNLKKHFPQAVIDAYIYEDCAPILTNNPNIRKLFLTDPNGKKKGFFKHIIQEMLLLKHIRKEKYDLVMLLTRGDHGTIVSYFSKAPIRISYAGKHQKFFTHHVKDYGAARHWVDIHLDFLRILGIFPEEEEKKMFFPVLNEKPLLESFHLMQDDQIKPYIIIHPSARWKFKCWPQKKFEMLSFQLIKDGHFIVFTGGKSQEEQEITQAIIQELPKNSYLNLCGQISISDLASLVKNAHLVVCPDSFILHLSSCFQKKTVVLFGSTSEIFWGPWQNPEARVVVEGKFRCRPCGLDGCGGCKISECLTKIDVEKVYQTVQELIQ